MENLKLVIPQTLKQKISESTTDDLNSTCSLLLHFFQNLSVFHQTVRDLTDPEMALCGKNKQAAMEAKTKGNECFFRGYYSSALRFYSKALRVSPADAEDMDKSLVATVYVNRASSFHKLGLFLESLRDCNRALIIYSSYAKAWFRRGKANASLENYKDATIDLKISLELETSLSGKRQIQSELNLVMDQTVHTTSNLRKTNEYSSDELLQIKLQCISTPTKGRGMASLADIPQGSLIHREDPYSAIILKHCRETHCHFCFNELPEDTVPCMSCSIPLYCSLQCQVQAGGQKYSKYDNAHGFHENLSKDFEDFVKNVTSLSLKSEQDIAEHRHECCGMHWPAVLPSDVVLAGRVIMRHGKQHIYSEADPNNFQGILDLCQNYGKLSGEEKLEIHVYAIILLYCLQQSHASRLPLNSTIVSQIIILLSQIRVNSMGIARIKFADMKQHTDVTSSVEQVRVAQAVYCRGSLFNHSCEPNVHAYFVSRTLFVRATDYVAEGSQLELSYGPQVGQWGYLERHDFLDDRYSFTCQCSGCEKLNSSDLVINAYRCTTPHCFGVVLDNSVYNHEKEKLDHFRIQNSSLGYSKFNDEKIRKIVQYISEQSVKPEHCLSCGSYCDLQPSHKAISEASLAIRRLQGAISSNAMRTSEITDALDSLSTLRTKLYPLNKRVAEVEDTIAQAFCLIGDMEGALRHSKASIEILEKLYGEEHIVIGHELIKVATIQQFLDRKSAAEYINRLVAIFSRHYGKHVDIVLGHLPILDAELRKSC